MRRLALGLVLAITLTVQARADFAAGVEAYDGGDLATAYAEWRALAEAGDASAGRPVDAAGAARWYRRAAEQGEPIAQLNLGEMYMLGIGVTRDAARAWLWLTLAARQGNAWAGRARAALTARVTRGDLARARTLIRSRNRR